MLACRAERRQKITGHILRPRSLNCTTRESSRPSTRRAATASSMKSSTVRRDDSEAPISRRPARPRCRSPDGCALTMPPQSPFSITSAIGDDELRLILAELAKTDLAPGPGISGEAVRMNYGNGFNGRCEYRPRGLRKSPPLEESNPFDPITDDAKHRDWNRRHLGDYTGFRALR